MKKEKKDGASEFSRRDFVKVAGLSAGVASTAVPTSKGRAASALPTVDGKRLHASRERDASQTPYSKGELLRRGPQFSYTGRQLDEIAFPIGGLGTGSISLGGWGQLRDWELMNRPAKGFVSPRSFFMLKVHGEGKTPVIKVLQGPIQGSYVGAGHSISNSYIRDDLGHTLPHFKNCTFTGHFPFATIDLEDPDVPVRVTLEAFNPFIPLNDKDSSIPVAIFSYTFENRTEEPLSARVFGNLTNVIGLRDQDDRVNVEKKEKGVTGLYQTTEKPDPRSPRHGSMVLATTCPRAFVWPRWKQNLHLREFWQATALSDGFPPGEEGESDTGTLAVDFTIPPKGKETVTFFVSWYFPTFERYWKVTSEDQLLQGYKLMGGEPAKKATWRNYYATIWTDAWDVLLYTASNLERLRNETRLFHDTLFASTLPVHVLDAVSSQLSTLNTTTCIRLEDGTFYGFEGSSNTGGCCTGSCSHVWYYAQALPYLFPNLQRSMTDAHFVNSFHEDGMMSFRMPLPPGRKFEPNYHPAADGQMGLILQVYRDWLLSGDDDWLRRLWPKTKKALEFSWKYWDADKDGVMEGMKHTTYNFQLHGPDPLSGGLYLAALRAAARMAEYLGERDKAAEYLGLFDRGSQWIDANLFNGEYYEQKVDPNARDVWPEVFRKMSMEHGNDERFKNWPKWQLGKGCLSDHMIGQWYARMLHLGSLYDESNARKAVASIFKYNWKPNLWNHASFLRALAVHGEAGAVICSWPKGDRPQSSLYIGGADEISSGFEYQVASLLIYEGMVEEGLLVTMGVRNRFRGDRRNPWDEFACGHHYSRAMASYALLVGLAGFKYSAPEKTIGFSPRLFPGDFCCFFSVASGWGLYSQSVDGDQIDHRLRLDYGALDLNRIELSSPNTGEPVVTVWLAGEKLNSDVVQGQNVLAVILKGVTLEQGHELQILIQNG